MSSLSQAKGIGAAGSILVLLGFFSSGGIVLAISGLILILVAVKYVADVIKDRELYGNIQGAILLSVVGTIIGFLVVFRGLFSLIGSITTGSLPSGDPLASFFSSNAAGLVATWVFFLGGAFFLKKSYDSIALGLDVDLFATTGKLFLIGAALIIVFGVGLIILLVAMTLQIAAFLSLPDEKRVPGSTDPASKPFGTR
jgi:uncharacterized membrane protein